MINLEDELDMITALEMIGENKIDISKISTKMRVVMHQFHKILAAIEKTEHGLIMEIFSTYDIDKQPERLSKQFPNRTFNWTKIIHGAVLSLLWTQEGKDQRKQMEDATNKRTIIMNKPLLRNHLSRQNLNDFSHFESLVDRIIKFHKRMSLLECLNIKLLESIIAKKKETIIPDIINMYKHTSTLPSIRRKSEIIKKYFDEFLENNPEIKEKKRKLAQNRSVHSSFEDPLGKRQRQLMPLPTKHNQSKQHNDYDQAILRSFFFPSKKTEQNPEPSVNLTLAPLSNTPLTQ